MKHLIENMIRGYGFMHENSMRPVSFEGNLISSQELLKEATIWFFTVTDNPGAIISSEMIFSYASN